MFGTSNNTSSKHTTMDTHADKYNTNQEVPHMGCSCILNVFSNLQIHIRTIALNMNVSNSGVSNG